MNSADRGTCVEFEENDVQRLDRNRVRHRRNAAISRLLGIAKLLSTHRRALRVAEIAEQLGIGWRTVYRDLERLEAAGFPVAMDRRGRTSYWSMLPTKVPETGALTNEEALAMMLAAEHLGYLDVTGIPAALRSVRARLGPQANASRALVGPRHPAVRRCAATPAFGALRRATEARRVVACRYFTLSRQLESDRCIHPYCIWLAGATVYVIAYCETRRQVLMFNLDRFRWARDAGRTFPQPHFDLDDYLQGALRVMRGGKARDVVVELDAWATSRLEERPAHATQRLERFGRGAALLRIRVVLSEEIVSFILGLGSHAVPLEPPELVATIATELASMREGLSRAEATSSAQLLLFPAESFGRSETRLSRVDKRHA